MKKALFIMGGPGSGKDYLINNILNRFNVCEVQVEQVLNGSARKLVASGNNILVNCNNDLDKVHLAKTVLEGYEFHHLLVSVTNKISRERNAMRANPMQESVRIRKWLDIERVPDTMEDVFVFRNSLNLSEASSSDLKAFQLQIEKFLGYMLDRGYIFEDFNDINPRPVLNSRPVSRKKRLKTPPNHYDARASGANLGGLTQTHNSATLVSSYTPNFKKFISERYKKK